MDIRSNIYNFNNYRDFLKDRYRQLKAVDPTFSFRSFSKEAGFGSPNYLKLVMDNKRNLSEEAVEKFAKGLRLDRHETEYFRFLVAHNQCNETVRRRVYEAKLEYLRELFEVKEVIPELYEYYHDWYHAAIREMIKKGGVRNEPSQIGEKLVPAITTEQAQKSVELLSKLNFITVNPDGTLECTERTEAIPEETAEKIYQEQMAELAAQSIYTQSDDTQGFESVTLSLPADRVGDLKAKIKDWLVELQESDNTSNADAVYQINVQLFALTRPIRKDQDQVSAPSFTA